MKKSLGNILLSVLKYALLIYSASRSLDFVQMTLPPDKQVLSYLTIAALDGGLVIWEQVYRHGSRGGGQRAIALIMTITDLIGAVVMFTLDTLYTTGRSGMTAAMSADEVWVAVLAMSAIIALNIGSIIAFTLAHPDVRKAAAEEEAQSRIEDLAIEKIQAASEQLAAELAPQLAADWVEETRLKNSNLLQGKRAARKRLPASTVDVPAQPIPATTIYQADTSTDTGTPEQQSRPDPTKRRRRWFPKA